MTFGRGGAIFPLVLAGTIQALPYFVGRDIPGSQASERGKLMRHLRLVELTRKRLETAFRNPQHHAGLYSYIEIERDGRTVRIVATEPAHTFPDLFSLLQFTAGFQNHQELAAIVDGRVVFFV